MSRGASASSSRSTGRRHPFFWVAAVAAPLCVVIYAGSAAAIWRYGNYAQSFGWTAAATRNGLVVASVEPGGAADGKLRTGDAIAGVSTGVIPPVGYYRRAAPADRPYSIHIASPRPTDVTLTAPVVRVARLGRLTTLFLSAVTFAAVGLFFGLVRPDLPTGRLLCLAAVGTGFNQLFATLDSFSDQLPWAARLVNGGLSLSVGIANAVLFQATVRLPGPSVPRILWPGLGTILYVLAAATAATFGVPGAILWWSDADVASRILFGSRSWFAAGPILRTVTELLASVGILAVLGWKLAFVRDPDEQRRLRWLFAGIIIATIPFATYKIRQMTLVSADPAALRDSLLRTISAGAIASVPLTLAYAVAKHRILDITVVVRRGLQYLLARNALTVVLLLPAAGLAYTVVVNQNRTIRETLFENPTYLALMGAALVALRFRRAMRDRLDRIFFREAYDRERVLLALVDEMDRRDSIDEVAALVGAELTRALHPQHVYVWVREKERNEFTLVHSSSVVAAPGRIPPDSRLLTAFERNPRAQAWRQDDHGSDSDHEWLNRLDVDLIVPIVGTDRRLSALLMLGEKKSEEPYSASDRELLEAIAKQLAVVCENVRLHERIDDERQIRDQVIDRLEGRAINLVKECPRCGACYDSDVATCVADGHELTISLPIERLVDRQYRLDRLIGKGGMGAVYEAADLRLQRKVAIKFLIGRALGEQTALRRFEREAQLCARLSHPNIVTVFDYGTLPSGAYLVMERLHGVTLRNELTRIGRLQPEAAADVFEQVLEGVKAAHAHGIVHRDLKPENVLIMNADTDSQRVKLLDFGLAQLRALDTAATATVTMAGVVVGTLGYMAPEQFTDVRADERADIFAFGVMLAEALTGKRPFDRPTYAGVLSSTHLEEFHLQGKTPEVRALDAELQRCLAKEPAARFGSVADVQRRLIPALRACPPNSISGRGV